MGNETKLSDAQLNAADRIAWNGIGDWIKATPGSRLQWAVPGPDFGTEASAVAAVVRPDGTVAVSVITASGSVMAYGYIPATKESLVEAAERSKANG